MGRIGSTGSALGMWMLLVLAGAAWGGARVTEWSATAAAAPGHEHGEHPDRGRGGGDGGGRGSGNGTGGSGGGTTDGTSDGTTGGVEEGPTSVGEEHRFVLMMGEVDPEVRKTYEEKGEPVPGSATEGRRDRFEYLAFYPERLTVHAGDTVELRRAGFHTLMFVDEIDGAPGFIRRDEVEGTSAFFGRNPTDTSCTFADGLEQGFVVPDDTPACVLAQDPAGWTTGTTSAVIEVQLDPGIYPFVCTVHSGMSGELEVVAEHVPVWTPEEVADQRGAAYAADTAAALQTMEEGKRPTVEAVGDTRVWTVKAGDFTPDGRVGITRFLPSQLSVAEGDEVRFVVPDANGRIDLHTVTFPNTAFPFGFLTYLNPMCDADGEETGAPGAPLLYPALVTGCPPGSVLELGFHPWAWRAPLRAANDLVTTPATVHDSGFLLPENFDVAYRSDPWTGQPMPNNSYARFGGPGVYGFQCNVHPEYGMGGSIRVIGGSA